MSQQLEECLNRKLRDQGFSFSIPRGGQIYTGLSDVSSSTSSSASFISTFYNVQQLTVSSALGCGLASGITGLMDKFFGTGPRRPGGIRLPKGTGVVTGDLEFPLHASFVGKAYGTHIQKRCSARGGCFPRGVKGLWLKGMMYFIRRGWDSPTRVGGIVGKGYT